MADAVLRADIDLRVEANPQAPAELQALGIAYWELAGLDPETGVPVWANRTKDLRFERWSGTAHYAAAAAVTATAANYECVGCGHALTLTSRQALANAMRGEPVKCRACDGAVEGRAGKILDPKSLQARTDRLARADARLQEEAAVRELEQARRAAINERYVVEPDSGEYLIDQASLLARIGALAVIHAIGDRGGLIYPISYDQGSIAPNPALARELFVAAWNADLLQVHPSSPANAFVWEDDRTLGDYSIYADRARFFVPGDGTLPARLADFTNALRVRLGSGVMWSTDRVELAGLAKRLTAEEAARYFVYMLREHNLPNLTNTHEEALRTITTTGAAQFSLGHLYRMAWSSARDASSAYQRNPGMSKDKAVTHGLKQFERWIQRAVDDPTKLGEPFNEDKRNLPLSAATSLVFRIILGLEPMTAAPGAVTSELAGSPDAELRAACDAGFPERHELIEWVRTTTQHWSGSDFRTTLAKLEDWRPALCAPHCAHERVSDVARESGRVYDRIVARVGDTDAAILTAEATGVANAIRNGVRTGDAVLAELVRRLRLMITSASL